MQNSGTYHNARPSTVLEEAYEKIKNQFFHEWIKPLDRQIILELLFEGMAEKNEISTEGVHELLVVTRKVFDTLPKTRVR